jgi:hypothetical protein
LTCLSDTTFLKNCKVDGDLFFGVWVGLCEE